MHNAGQSLGSFGKVSTSCPADSWTAGDERRPPWVHTLWKIPDFMFGKVQVGRTLRPDSWRRKVSAMWQIQIMCSEKFILGGLYSQTAGEESVRHEFIHYEKFRLCVRKGSYWENSASHRVPRWAALRPLLRLLRFLSGEAGGVRTHGMSNLFQTPSRSFIVLAILHGFSGR